MPGGWMHPGPQQLRRPQVWMYSPTTGLDVFAGDRSGCIRRQQVTPRRLHRAPGAGRVRARIRAHARSRSPAPVIRSQGRATPRRRSHSFAQAPGDRHGFVRVQSLGPEDTFTLFVRYCGAFSVGSPGMMEILGCLTLGCEKSMHAPLSGLRPGLGTPPVPGLPLIEFGCSQNPPAPWPLSAPGHVFPGYPCRVDGG